MGHFSTFGQEDSRVFFSFSVVNMLNSSRQVLRRKTVSVPSQSQPYFELVWREIFETNLFNQVKVFLSKIAKDLLFKMFQSRRNKAKQNGTKWMSKWIEAFFKITFVPERTLAEIALMPIEILSKLQLFGWFRFCIALNCFTWTML